ncbi:ABC transporter permease [Ruminococcus sp.]|uniref:ABC transporter permease n=1 Tax=Ruminococcus sp. TaxID=41978 RepID=UPI0025EF8C70|nr:ABC transporter permease [Ruminococcus sp.]MBQ8966324.1 ABC transporter permease [Ruminococcus sp.]
MYPTILKKDLKRKKTINCILLLFIVLSTMFAASSVNNIISVAGGIDSFLDKAGVTDYFIISGGDTADVENVLDNSKYVSDYKREEAVLLQGKELFSDGEVIDEDLRLSLVQSVDRLELNIFDEKDEKLTEVPKGKFYSSSTLADKGGLDKGDKLTIKKNGAEFELEYAGHAKDAVLGSNFTGTPRIIVNEADYKELLDNKEAGLCSIGLYYMNTTDMDGVQRDTADICSVLFSGDRALIRMTYILDMVIAAIMLVVCVALILIAFSVLRFTIGLSLTEEFREIGVMKAVGLKNISVRTLYMVKYLGLALVGAAIGFFLSLPFGRMLLLSSSKSMVLSNDNSIGISIVSAAAVVVIIMLFCWSCTGRIKKMSPIDAVRSGQTGERFRKKGMISLSKSKLGAGSFLPLNDVLSQPKTYGMMTVIFSICMVLIMVLATTANTLRDGGLVGMLGCIECDLYIDPGFDDVSDIQTGNVKVGDRLAEMEKKLADNGMPAKITLEGGYFLPVEFGDKKLNLEMMLNKDTDTADYDYVEGTAPQNVHEIALSTVMCEQLGADIGDKLKITINDKQEEYLLTAKFVSMQQAGKVGRLYQDVDLDYTEMDQHMECGISFDDHPDRKTILERQEKIKDIMDNGRVFTVGEFVDISTNSADTIDMVKYMVLAISVIIILLISVLMERSFISKEKSEIALMKALGFRNSSVSAHHSVRFIICAVAAGILANILCLPLTKLIMTPVFSMLGGDSDIPFKFDPLEISVVYPVLMAAVTVIGASLTAIYTRTIKASDTADIE